MTVAVRKTNFFAGGSNTAILDQYWSLSWRFDELTIRWVDDSMSWRFDELTIRWVDNSMSWQFDELTIRWVESRWVERRPVKRPFEKIWAGLYASFQNLSRAWPDAKWTQDLFGLKTLVRSLRCEMRTRGLRSINFYKCVTTAVLVS